MRYLVILILFCSCNPLRHYQKVVNDPFRNEKERELLARASLQEFPPVSGEPNTVITVDSSEIERLNQEYNKLVDAYIEHLEADTSRGSDVDTVFLTKVRALKPAVVTKTITKEIPIRDKRIEDQMQGKIDACTRENLELDIAAKEAKEKQKKTKTTNIWLYVTTGLLAIGHIIRTKKLFA